MKQNMMINKNIYLQSKLCKNLKQIKLLRKTYRNFKNLNKVTYKVSLECHLMKTQKKKENISHINKIFLKFQNIFNNLHVLIKVNQILKISNLI